MSEKLIDVIRKYPTVKRGDCRDCGNPWWFDKGEMGWVCTTCAKTHAKSTSEEHDQPQSDVPQTGYVSESCTSNEVGDQPQTSDKPRTVSSAWQSWANTAVEQCEVQAKEIDELKRYHQTWDVKRAMTERDQFQTAALSFRKTMDRYREALEKINCGDDSISGNWVTAYELRNIAREALAEKEPS